MALNLSGIPDTQEIYLPGFPDTDDVVENSNHYIALDTKEVDLPPELQKDTRILIEVPNVDLVKKDESRNAKIVSIYTVFVVKGNNNWELKYPLQKFIEFEHFLSLYSKGSKIPNLSSLLNLQPVSTSMFKRSAPEETPEICEGRKLPLQTWLQNVVDMMNVEEYYIVDDFFQYTENSLVYAYKQNDLDLILQTLNKFSKLYDGYTYQVQHPPIPIASRGTPSSMLSPIPFSSPSIETELNQLLGLIQDCNNKGNNIINQLYMEQGNEQQKMASLASDLQDIQKQCVQEQNRIDAQIQSIKNDIETLCARIGGINNDIDKYIKNQTSLKSTSLSYSLTSRYYKLLYEQIHTTLSVYRDVKDHTFPRGRKGSNTLEDAGENGASNDAETNQKPAIEYKEGVFLGSEMFIEEIHLKQYQKAVDAIVKKLKGADITAYPNVSAEEAAGIYNDVIENPPTFESIPPLLQTITQDLFKDNAQIRSDLNSMGIRHPNSLYNYFTKDMNKPKNVFKETSAAEFIRPTLSQAMKNPNLYKESDTPLYGLKPVSNQYDEPAEKTTGFHKSTNPFDMDGDEEEEESTIPNNISSPKTPSLAFLNKPSPTTQHSTGALTPKSTNPFDDMDDEEEEGEQLLTPKSTNPFDDDIEDEEEGEQLLTPKSTNPFDDDIEEEEEVPSFTTQPNYNSNPFGGSTQASSGTTMNNLFDDLVPLSAVSSNQTHEQTSKPAPKSPEHPNSAAHPNSVMSFFNNAQKNAPKPASSNTNQAMPSVLNNLFKKNFNTSNTGSSNPKSENKSTFPVYTI